MTPNSAIDASQRAAGSRTIGGKEDEGLFLSTKGGHAWSTNYWLTQGADPNAQDDEGMTALHHAAALGARGCVRVLVACGKCDYLLKDDRGRYASDLAAEWARDYAVARLLRKKQRHQADAREVPAWEPSRSGPAER